MRRVTPAKKQHEALVAMAKRRGDHLESPPSLWKASGLEPSFMNFMVKTKGTLSCSLSLCPSVSLPLCFLLRSDKLLYCFSSACSLLPFHASRFPPALCLRFFRCSVQRAVEVGDRPSSRQVVVVVVPRNTHGSSRKRDERVANGVVRWEEAGGIYYCSWFFTATLVCVVRLRRLQIARTQYFCSFFSFFISNFLENYYVFFLRRCYSTSLFMSCTRTLSIWKDARCRACVDCTVKSPCAPCLSSSMSCSTETVIPFGSL
jgi:hypothetical protein